MAWHGGIVNGMALAWHGVTWHLMCWHRLSCHAAPQGTRAQHGLPSAATNPWLTTPPALLAKPAHLAVCGAARHH